jgi:hypothetical protein
MCCFSGEVERVANTKIFARHLEGGRQALIYSMSLSADEDLAMLLPIPTPARSPEDAVRFVSLEGYPTIFDAINAAFPVFMPLSASNDGSRGRSAAPTLEVHQVGAFEASFVPHLDDMSRLDPRFRMPAGAWDVLARKKRREELPRMTQAQWDALPDYRDWGFAVFKLRAGAAQEVHPMAFTFATRTPTNLFFPTVHVHDGAYPLSADFSHTLYFQTDRTLAVPEANRWEESPGIAGETVEIARAQGLVAEDQHLYRQSFHGPHPNRDVTVLVG